MLKLFTLLLLISTSFAWKLETNKDGVQIFSQKIPGSPLLAFRAVGYVDAPLGEMLAILRNVEVATKWDDSLKVKRTLEDKSELEAETYSIVKIPFPFDDRDLVLNNSLSYDEKTHELIVLAKSVVRADTPPNKRYVRAHIKFAEFRIIPENETYIKISMECHVDPKGNIPNWLVNFIQQDLPYDFIKNLEKFAKIFKLKPNPSIQKFMAQQAADLKKIQKLSKVDK